MVSLLYYISAGNSKLPNKSSPVPRRSPPPPPSSGDPSQHSVTSKAGGSGGQLGAFWSTQHAKDSSVAKDKSEPIFDEEPTSHGTIKLDRIHQDNHISQKNSALGKEDKTQTQTVRRNSHGPLKDVDRSFFQKDTDNHTERPKASNAGSLGTFQDEAFNTFVAEFDTRKLSSEASNNYKSNREQTLEAELENLKEQLKEANLEKAEITSKFEKLSAICRSQRQEIQELKQAVAARTPSPNKDASRNQTSSGARPSAASVVVFLCQQFIRSALVLDLFWFISYNVSSLTAEGQDRRNSLGTPARER